MIKIKKRKVLVSTCLKLNLNIMIIERMNGINLGKSNDCNPKKERPKPYGEIKYNPKISIKEGVKRYLQFLKREISED